MKSFPWYRDRLVEMFFSQTEIIFPHTNRALLAIKGYSNKTFICLICKKFFNLVENYNKRIAVV